MPRTFPALAKLPITGALLAGAVLLSGLSGCANGPSAAREDETSGALQGELSAVSVLGSNDRSSMIYFLRVPGGAQPIQLIFDADPNLPSGTSLRVWGEQQGDGFHVTRQVIAPPSRADSQTASRSSALIGQPSTQHTVAWVQMDVNGGGVNQTAATAQQLIFATTAAGPLFGTKTGSKSVVQYYDENSYGMVQLTGQVEGPIPFTGTACNNFDPLAQNVVAQVTALGRTYDHYYLYWGSEQPCGPGWGDQGTRSKPGKYVWLNNDGTFCTATGQELGHNFGMMHASTMACTGATLANDTSTCTSNEYGNPMTVMGGGCGHLNAIEKWYDGFFQGCNAVKLKSSGTFTLFPIEIPCNGIQALQIPMPAAAPVRTTTTDQSNGNVTVAYYYLELRGGQGMDTGMKKGVYVHVAADIPAPAVNGVRTFLLDMNPATTTTFDAMTAGQTFTDPAGGVSFTVNSFDQNSASITVDIEGGTAGNTCSDGTTLAGAGPTSCGSAGGPDGGSTDGGDAGVAGTGGTPGTGGRGAGGGSGAGGSGPGSGGTTGTTGTGGAGVGGAPAGGTGGARGGTGGATGTGGLGGGGVGGSNGAGSGGSGAGGAGQPADAGTTGAVTGGCACELGRSSDHEGWRRAPELALLFVGLGLVLGRRRSPRRARAETTLPQL